MVAAVAFDTPDVPPRIVRSHEFQDRLRNQPVRHDTPRPLDIGPLAAGVEVDLRTVGQPHLIARGHALLHRGGNHLDVVKILFHQRLRRIGQFVHPDRNFVTAGERRRRKKPRTQQGNPESFHRFSYLYTPAPAKAGPQTPQRLPVTIACPGRRRQYLIVGIF